MSYTLGPHKNTGLGALPQNHSFQCALFLVDPKTLLALSNYPLLLLCIPWLPQIMGSGSKQIKLSFDLAFESQLSNSFEDIDPAWPLKSNR